MNTIQAFKYVISQRDCHERTGVRRTLISQYRAWLEGKGTVRPTINKMEEIIVAYGGTVIQEKKWKV